MRLLIIFTLFILTSCNELKEGKVIYKGVEPAHEYLYMMPIPHVISTGNTTITTYTYIPIWMYDDEDYYIKIEGMTTGGDKIVELFYMSEKQQNCIKIGDTFLVSEDCSSEPNVDVKVEQ